MHFRRASQNLCVAIESPEVANFFFDKAASKPSFGRKSQTFCNWCKLGWMLKMFLCLSLVVLIIKATP
eukprot:m.212079 g.212079  ORF g.212079 m.212079 type:complete len:68 (+) comp39769_c0_seq15:266-469(+)